MSRSTLPAPPASSLGGVVRPWLVPAAIGAATVLAVVLGESAYHTFTHEDGICEWLQELFFILALVEAVRARSGYARVGRRLPATLYLVAIGGLFFLAGEEISWGQRIFGWSTPEEFAGNRQGETTLHNMGAAQDVVGWVLLLIGIWGGVLPRLLRKGGMLDRWRADLQPFVPSEHHIPYFLPMLFWRIYRNIFPLPASHTYAIVQLNEPLELIMAIGFWLFFRERRRETRAAASAVRAEASVAR